MKVLAAHTRSHAHAQHVCDAAMINTGKGAWGGEEGTIWPTAKRRGERFSHTRTNTNTNT